MEIILDCGLPKPQPSCKLSERQCDNKACVGEYINLLQVYILIK